MGSWALVIDGVGFRGKNLTHVHNCGWVPVALLRSLKVLHYYLDDPKVACVLITNDPLDAAKMNRAVVVHRQAPELGELKLLLCGSMGYVGHGDDPVITALCTAYYSLMSRRDALQPGGVVFRERFGLRDLYSTL
jgi:hypothetical protein